MQRNVSVYASPPSRLFPAPQALVLVAAIAVGAAGVRADDFVVDDQIVSDPNSDLPAPEFDASASRMIWQDRFNDLWVARVDGATGAIFPPDGRGSLIDSGLASVGEVGNTPRISYGDEDVLIYTKDVDGVKWLAVARNPMPGVWTTELLENGDNRLRANGTPEGTTGPARMVYNRITDSGDVVVSWRDWNDPATEGTAEVIAEGGRFLGTEPSVLTLTRDENGFTQILLVDLATGTGELITSSATNKINPFIWYAPEFQDFAFVVMLNFTDLAVYRRVDGVWTEYNRFQLPAVDKPLLSSPEAFAHNGRSYITVVAAEELGQSDTFPGQPVGPSEIWLAGIDPDAPFFRRIDDPTSEAQRSEPEPYLLDSGPVAYYTERLGAFPFTRLLRRADTGLGPDFAYDFPTSNGGAWSGVHRDNRNCSCVPFPLADTYEAGEAIDVPGVQFAGASLAGNGTLLYTSRNTRLQTEDLVAVDTRNGVERFRISGAGLGTGLANAPVLVDRDDNFYLSAGNLIAKFAPDGTELWRTPIAGFTAGPQFLPSGLMVLFTWNAVAYVIDPADGAVVLEQTLAPGRPFPQNPNCLNGGRPASCAYVQPLAVDGEGTLYASLIRGNDRGLLQSFRYDAAANRLENRWGAASVPLPAPAGAPVIDHDGETVYVQSGDGRLYAVDARTPAVAWTWAASAAAGEPPAVQGDLLLVGGLAGDGATGITVLRDTLGGPSPVFETAQFLPRSRAAAAPGGRFVLAVEAVATGEVQLGVIDTDTGTLTTSPWAAGPVPTNLRSLTVRQDGAVIVEGWGARNNVAVFTPAVP